MSRGSTRILSWLLPAILTWGGAWAPAAGALTIDRTSWVVLATTSVNVPPTFTDDDAAGASTSASGDFLEAAVASAGLSDISNVNAEALQDSVLDLDGRGVLVAEGAGSVGVAFDVFDPGFPSRATGNGETGFSLIFTTAAPAIYDIGLSLRAELAELSVFSAPRPVDVGVVATALLVGANSGVIFERRIEDVLVDGLEETDSLSLFGTLGPDTYLLELFASVELQGFEDSVGLATAGFGYDVTIVPEPGTALLLGFGLLGLGARRRSSR